MDPSLIKRRTKEEAKLDKKTTTMKYQYEGHNLASKLEDEVQWVTDTEIGHIEFEDIKTQLQREPHALEAPYKRIKRLGLVEAIVFPQAMQSPKLIMTIAKYYQQEMRQCVDANGNIIVDLSPDMIGYYRRFIRDFNKMATPLYSLLTKDVKFHWTEDCEQEFLNLKEALTQAPVLKCPNWEFPFHIHIDTSDYAIGAVLGQKEALVEHAIYFINKNLQGAEFNHIVTEKKC
ncbi:uncharacterized protein LOC131874098 [Cryptomeria japonica]|uniref:uncharacterized protein LOC131874098 n=1 Tax=Cryptomeria japonica TaxID=3369 RepID=UPI0027DA468C|nr:uncharacterized protein LOC131874098 [Cryptomeria japonica]